MLEAVIFDMDGVIINSEPLHYKANQDLFDKLGFSVPSTEYSNYIGISNEKMWEDLKSKYDLNEELEDLTEKQKKHTHQYIQENMNGAEIPGIKKILEELKDMNIKTAIASSSSKDLIETVIKGFDLCEYFDVLVSGEEVKNGKPNPDIFLLASDKLKVNIKNCVIIEDSTNGVKAAKKSGAKCIGFNNPDSPGQSLKKADIIINKFDILNYDLIISLLK
ncbi:MAG: HAD family hydrolase [Thermotogota bacterium]